MDRPVSPTCVRGMDEALLAGGGSSSKAFPALQVEPVWTPASLEAVPNTPASEKYGLDVLCSRAAASRTRAGGHSTSATGSWIQLARRQRDGERMGLGFSEPEGFLPGGLLKARGGKTRSGCWL
jgi:hypothetical protein